VKSLGEGDRMKRLGVVLALLVAVFAVTAGVASADYGKGAVYQVEITANLAGPQGGGIWLWIELDGNGTGAYQGADCGHGGGAIHDSGDVTWQDNGNGTISISGVNLLGLEFAFGIGPTTITVPSTYGHTSYGASDNPFLTIFDNLPGFLTGGKAQVQVAP
jgi:hypothetical protein